MSLIPDDSNRLRVTIIIDALDECEDRGNALLQTLNRLVQYRPRSVRLLLSSQMHVEVEELYPLKSTQPERTTI